MDDISSTFSIFPDSQWFYSAVDSEWFELKWLEEYQPSWTGALLVSAVAVYFVWYYLLVVNKPRLVGGGTALKEHILSHCPILSQYYYPTFWAPNCHFTTIGREQLQKCPGVTYKRCVTCMITLVRNCPIFMILNRLCTLHSILLYCHNVWCYS